MSLTEKETTWQLHARLWGEEIADLNALPENERLARIAQQQALHDTENDLNWPTEGGGRSLRK